MTYGTTISKLKSYCGPHADQIGRAINVHPDYLADMIYKLGEEFVRDNKALLHSKEYWNWFKMVWYSHDASFLTYCRHKNVSQADYISYHRTCLQQTEIDREVYELVTGKRRAA